MNPIEYLSTQIDNKDNTSSSYWDHQHKDFKYENGVLKDAKGFGMHQKPYNKVLKMIHTFFQKKYVNYAMDQKNLNSILFEAQTIVDLQGRGLDLDVLRQCLTIEFLSHKGVFKNLDKIVIIGDGWGLLASLCLKLGLAKTVVSVNLTKTLLANMIYIEKVFGVGWLNENSMVIKDKEDIKKIKDQRHLILEAKNYELLKYIQKSLVINIASIQEMDLEVIHNYMSYLYYQKEPFYFYLCNRIEKYLPDGSLIKFEEYGLNEKDDLIVNELCKWHQDFYTLRPPSFRKYDGEHIHQLRYCNK